MTIRESDWETFRKLRERALDRFCQRILDECGEQLCPDTGRSAHERYLGLYGVVRERDQEIEVVFDPPRRSRMMSQIYGMHVRGLFTEEELASFSDELRAWLCRTD